jgi:hypothetical protein
MKTHKYSMGKHWHNIAKYAKAILPPQGQTQAQAKTSGQTSTQQG